MNENINSEEDKLLSLIKEKKEKELLHTQTIIDFNKEEYKNIISVYYSSQANFDKIVMTIFFGEIGYLVHTIKDNNFNLWFLCAMIVNSIGIFYALKRYDADTQGLSYTKEKISAETKDLLGINDYSSDILMLESEINKLNKVSRKYLFYIKSLIICSSATTVETIYFIKQKIILPGFLISTIGLVVLVSLINYFGGNRNECKS